jgi:hypothetical protein
MVVRILSQKRKTQSTRMVKQKWKGALCSFQMHSLLFRVLLFCELIAQVLFAVKNPPVANALVWLVVIRQTTKTGGI